MLFCVGMFGFPLRFIRKPSSRNCLNNRFWPVFTPFSETDPRPPGALGQGTWSQCPNLRETRGGFDGEQYDCEVCGERLYLDYEDMK